MKGFQSREAIIYKKKMIIIKTGGKGSLSDFISPLNIKKNWRKIRKFICLGNYWDKASAVNSFCFVGILYHIWFHPSNVDILLWEKATAPYSGKLFWSQTPHLTSFSALQRIENFFHLFKKKNTVRKHLWNVMKEAPEAGGFAKGHRGHRRYWGHSGDRADWAQETQGSQGTQKTQFRLQLVKNA